MLIHDRAQLHHVVHLHAITRHSDQFVLDGHALAALREHASPFAQVRAWTVNNIQGAAQDDGGGQAVHILKCSADMRHAK
jgi:hypothetical protein